MTNVIASPALEPRKLSLSDSDDDSQFLGDIVVANLRSASMAGLISSVIWMLISTAVGLGKTPVIVGGIVFLIGTTLITMVISMIIVRSKGAGRSS